MRNHFLGESLLHFTLFLRLTFNFSVHQLEVQEGHSSWLDGIWSFMIFRERWQRRKDAFWAYDETFSCSSRSGTVQWQGLKMNSIVMKNVMTMRGVIMRRSVLLWWIDNDFVTLIAYYFFFSTSCCCVFKIVSSSVS